MKRLLAICLMLFAAFAYAQDNPELQAKEERPAAAAPAGFKAQVQKMADDWKAAFKAKDADRIASMYTEDAVLINPDGTYKGSADIKAEIKKMIDRGDTVDSVTTISAIRGGDIGIAEGTYSGKGPAPGGGQAQGRGHWAVTLKNVNGTWMLATHTSVPVMHAGGRAKKKAR